jgi:hypothetical protein
MEGDRYRLDGHQGLPTELVDHKWPLILFTSCLSLWVVIFAVSFIKTKYISLAFDSD